MARGIFCAILAAALLVALDPPTFTATAPADRLLGWINDRREQPLTVSWPLRDIARRHTREMCSVGFVYPLEGRFVSVSDFAVPGRLWLMFRGWMGNDGIRTKLLWPGFTRVGASVRECGGVLFVAVVLR